MLRRTGALSAMGIALLFSPLGAKSG